MYVKVIDGEAVEYPYSLSGLRRDNPNVSFPREISDEILAEYGVFPVVKTEQPASTTTADPDEGIPVLVDGVWMQVWTMVDVSPEEAEAREQDEQDKVQSLAVKQDTFVKNFISMSPAQVAAYVEGNTANLAQVRSLLTKMALMLLLLARKEYR
jgi:hypothetical protein